MIYYFIDSGAKGQLIGPEGIEKLCADLDVDPSDVSNFVVTFFSSLSCKHCLILIFR